MSLADWWWITWYICICSLSSPPPPHIYVSKCMYVYVEFCNFRAHEVRFTRMSIQNIWWALLFYSTSGLCYVNTEHPGQNKRKRNTEGTITNGQSKDVFVTNGHQRQWQHWRNKQQGECKQNTNNQKQANKTKHKQNTTQKTKTDEQHETHQNEVHVFYKTSDMLLIYIFELTQLIHCSTNVNI